MNQIDGDKIILRMQGSMKRSRDCGTPFLFYVNKSVLNDINIHCTGQRQSVLNELIKIGLKKLKDDEND